MRHGHGNWQAAADEWRSHWRLGLSAFLALGLSQGAFQALFSLFVMPLQAEFGWSRGEIASAYYGSLGAAFAAPFIGRAVDRFGVRRLMLGGMCLSALIYVALAMMTGSLALFYLLTFLSMVIGLSASGLTCSRVVSEAFVASRGISLAIARSGLSLATAVLPPILFAAMSLWSWRVGYLVEALLVVTVALPAVYLWIGRNEAADCGGRLSRTSGLPKWSALAFDRRVVLLCLAAGLGYAPSNSLMSQLQPLLVGKGVEPGQAAWLIGMAGVASVAGALLTGALIDRFWAPAVAFVFACGSALGTLICALNTSLDAWNAGAAVMLIGFGLGAEIDVVAFVVARYFGVRSFASIYGITVFSIALFGALGASLLGFAHDRFGNYDVALMIIAGCFVGAGCTYLSLGRYPDMQAPDDAAEPAARG